MITAPIGLPDASVKALPGDPESEGGKWSSPRGARKAAGLVGMVGQLLAPVGEGLFAGVLLKSADVSNELPQQVEQLACEDRS